MSSTTIYLVRHEDAEPGHDIPDSHRALTGLGRTRMRKTGKLVLEHAVIDVVYTSPLVRAVQTAEILAGELGIDETVLARDVIANPPSLQSIMRLVDDTTATARGIAIVGHEPTLGELVAHLLGLDQYGFRKGGVLALDYDRKTKKVTFKWVINPKGPDLKYDLE
jgi:phosphohistidine phosphatase